MPAETLVDEFFEVVPKEERLTLAPGDLAWAPVTYLEDEFVSARVARTVPSDDSQTTFEVAVYKADEEPGPPVKSIGLRSSERIRIARMKHRPVVVLSSRVDGWTDRKGDRKRSSTPARLVVPLYTAEPYGTEFISRVQRFEYNTHFWVPANSGPGRKPDRACFARFEQAGAVRERLIKPVHCRLHPDALQYLRAWFNYFLDGRHNELSGLLAELYATPDGTTS